MTMSETLERLKRTDPNLPTVQKLAELQASVKVAVTALESMQNDLHQMPQELGQALSQQLLPLSDLSAKVRTLAVQFDQLNQRQRATLDALTAEMTAKASESFATEAAKLGQAIEAQTSAIKALDATAKRAESAMKKLAKLPQQLDEAKLEMIDAADTIKQRIPSLGQMLGLMVGAGLIAGAVAAGAVLFLASKPPAPRESAALQQQPQPLASQRTSSLTRAR